MTTALWDQLGLTGWQALAMFIDATILFWFFTLLMLLMGQQMRARVTVTSFALMTVVGSVAARAMLGPHPTMAGGILILVSLFAWEAVFRVVARHVRLPFAITRQPRVVMTDGVADERALTTVHVSSTDLYVRLRRKGVTSLTEVKWAVVESDGSLTVIRAGEEVDPELLVGVIGL